MIYDCLYTSPDAEEGKRTPPGENMERSSVTLDWMRRFFNFSWKNQNLVGRKGEKKADQGEREVEEVVMGCVLGLGV